MKFWPLWIYRTAVPFVLTLILFLIPFQRKLRETVRLRLKPINWPDWLGHHPTLWVHCASGEFEYAKPVIREWRSLVPNGRVFVTYFSPSYKAAIENDRNVDGSAPLPFDLPGPLSHLIRRLKPSVLAISRTDVWPEACFQAHIQKVPVVLFSRTQSTPATGLRGLVQKLGAIPLRMVDHILAVSDEDARNIRALRPDASIRTVGDSRYDQVLKRLESPKTLAVAAPQSEPPILVAGSTWPEDEAVLFRAAQDLIRAGQLRLVLVPHEPTPHHMQSLQDQCQQLGLNFSLYSQIQTWTLPVLLVDQVGILAELYQWGQWALVGGSYKKSVHSVMEPLAAGLVTIVGPHHHNNREAIEMSQVELQKDLFAVNVCNSAPELESLLRTHCAKTIAKEQVKSLITSRAGASKRIAQIITQFAKSY